MKFYNELTEEEQKQAIKKIRKQKGNTLDDLPLFDFVSIDLHNMLLNSRNYMFDKQFKCWIAIDHTKD